MSYKLTNTEHADLEEALHYVTKQWCNENKLSGELAWLLVQTISTAQLETFKGNRR